jgi:hypothetical protein
MKTVIIFLIALSIASTAVAAPIENVTSSALMPGDSVVFNLDFLDPFGLPIFDVSIQARISNFPETYSVPLEHVDFPPYYLNTYAGSWIFEEPVSVIEYYGRVEAETLVMTQSFRNTGNQFPPEMVLYADLAEEAVGDTLPGTPGSWLDLAGHAITYSDNRIFARLDNVGGGWPTDDGGLEFYIYAFALYNPDDLGLSATAMVYADVPFFLDPGLYHVDLQDTTFERIADIQYSYQGTNLHMTCTIEDLLSDPDWNTWPPESGFALAAGLTITVSLFEPFLSDYTYPGAFVPITRFLDIIDNNAPLLLSPQFGVFPDSALVAGILYLDPDNNLPVQKSLLFDGSTYEMGSYVHSYDGSSSFFFYSMQWPGDGWHTYSYHFSDGAELVETELDSIYLSPTGIIDDDLVPKQFALSQNYPNPFNSSTNISFALTEAGHVKLDVYDIAGRLVTTLVNADVDAGQQTVIWDGTGQLGLPVSSGIYFYTLRSGNDLKSHRMLLLK